MSKNTKVSYRNADFVETAQSSFSNPIIENDFPDPCVIKAGDGYYYVFSTQDSKYYLL